MTRMSTLRTLSAVVAGLFTLLAVPTAGADELDALALESAPESTAQAAERPLRLFLEGAVGRSSQRYGLSDETVRRASLDLRWAGRPAPGLRVALSNRLDHLEPEAPGYPSTVNSVREAFVGWQDALSRWGIDAGRVNWRLGPAYGFNPTDYFRDGSLRVVTTVDPLATRDNRMGTVMLRGQHLTDRGWATTLALAPKLDDDRSADSFSLDLGATNPSDRALLAVSTPSRGGASGQATVFYERGKGLQLGVSATTALSDAAVAYLEWSGGRDRVWQPGVEFAGDLPVRTRHRAAAGLTYTTTTRAELTLELQYNGFAADRALWRSDPVDGAAILGDYLLWVQQRQDLAPRRAVMLYAVQRSLLAKRLDLTGLLRWNADDGSRFLWLEGRYRWSHVDLALQYQRSTGAVLSEYGLSPGRQLVQVLAAYYF